MINVIIEGFGVYQYNNPFFRYEGTWQDGKKHGKYNLFIDLETDFL